MSTLQNFIGLNKQSDVVPALTAQSVHAFLLKYNNDVNLLNVAQYIADIATHAANTNNPHRVAVSDLFGFEDVFYQLYLKNTVAVPPMTQTVFTNTIINNQLSLLEFFETLILNDSVYDSDLGVKLGTPFDVDYAAVLEPFHYPPVFYTAPQAPDMSELFFTTTTPPLVTTIPLRSPVFSGFVSVHPGSADTIDPVVLTLSSRDKPLTTQTGQMLGGTTTLTITFSVQMKTVSVDLRTVYDQAAAVVPVAPLILMTSVSSWDPLSYVSANPLLVQCDVPAVFVCFGHTSWTVTVLSKGSLSQTTGAMLALPHAYPLVNLSLNSLMYRPEMGTSSVNQFKTICFWSEALDTETVDDIFYSWLI